MAATSTFSNNDPFAAQRAPNEEPFATQQDGTPNVDPTIGTSEEPSDPNDHRMSREWDASKVPPSQFQKRRGSIYSTPASKDTHHHDKERDKAFHDKLKEKGWNLLGKKS